MNARSHRTVHGVYSRHAPGHVRDYFLKTVENGKPSRALAGDLWNCTDILPGWACDQLDIPTGSTYAQAARKIVNA